MIRRTKKEVLPELPPKIRVWHEVAPDLSRNNNNELFDRYQLCTELARQNYSRYLITRDSESQLYLQYALGNIEQARTILGLIKISDGELANYIKDIVAQKGACIVFCAHHAVSDGLCSQLSKLGVTNKVVDGRTKQIDRKIAEESFQNGEIEVFIGGIKAAGEAITLTRSDICIFVEPDWVPAAMMQAEDRGHRIGQESNGYQIIHWVISHKTGLVLDQYFTSLLRRKIEIIDHALDEKSDFEFSESDNNGSLKLSLMKEMFGD
jgi:SNF2 family DNA or RNA helicase